MKKLILSMAAASLVTGAVATADVDVNVGGQAVVYYQTNDSVDFFHQDSSNANVGLQLNLDADLGNGFGAGGQYSMLGTLGLEKNLVSNIMQTGNGNLNGGALTKVYLTKKAGNTLIKVGRQELPKSLSPLAFSEGWNVFKNTFDAVVAINSDLPETTLVGAYVSASNNHGDLSNFNDLAASTQLGALDVQNGAYMLTAATKLIPATSLTASYYYLDEVGGLGDASALWLDAQIAVPVVSLAVQAGTIMPDIDGTEDTVAFGAKAGMNLGPVAASLAYTDVDDGTANIQNVGTGVKTPLYTQMVANQGFISNDSSTFVAKAALGLGTGKLIAQYGMSSRGGAENDYNELDVIYKFKALEMNMLAAYVMRGGDDNVPDSDIIRFWTRYNF
ncbi:MAG: hypothetical protein U9P71_01245 [Campylobacterota bacterium]|nr:hypothetical protein [Campylobacterota bacterium]